jgi:FtsH-binding integral membrane protein
MPSAVAGSLTAQRRSALARTALYLGAVAVLATGAVHIQQYYGNGYSTVPTIGTLFFLNFVSALVITAGLVAPLGRVAGRHAGSIRALFAVGGIGLAVLSLVSLFVSESSSLFGFTEFGYRTPIVLAIVAEVAAAVFLLIYLAAARSGERGGSHSAVVTR